MSSERFESSRSRARAEAPAGKAIGYGRAAAGLRSTVGFGGDRAGQQAAGAENFDRHLGLGALDGQKSMQVVDAAQRFAGKSEEDVALGQPGAFGGAGGGE